jgi:uncharacterized protein (DUF983 family)
MGDNVKVEVDDIDPRSATCGPPGTIRLIVRGLALRCPACGRGKVFRGWFTMNDACSCCGRAFNRGPGYFLGSIYFNYGVTSAIVIVLFFSVFFTDVLTGTQLLAVLSLFTLVFPVWFFRYARALWIAFDELWDPWPRAEQRERMENDQSIARADR